MQRLLCDGCQQEITDAVYYTVGEIMKHLPRSKGLGTRVLFKDQEREVLEEESPWVYYADRHYCPECFRTPLDLAGALATQAGMTVDEWIVRGRGPGR